MNYIDLILCIPLLWGLYKGFTKGLILEAASIVSLFIAVWGGVKFSDFVTAYLQTNMGWETKYLPIISFAIIFIAVLAGIYMLAKILEKIIEAAALGFVNKLAGGAFGMLKFGLIISVFIFVLNAIETSFSIIPEETKETSLLYKPVGKIAPLIIPGLRDSKVGEMIKLPSLDNMLTKEN